MLSEAQKRAQRKYNQKCIRTICLKLNKTIDKDCLDMLDSQENKQGYVKNLIREDIKKRSR